MFHAVYYHAVPLTALEFAFLMTLVGAAKNKDYLPSPSLKRIANRSGMSKGAVVKASQSLQRKGIIETKSRRTEKGQMYNVYIIHPEKLGREKPLAESEKGSQCDLSTPRKGSCCDPIPSQKGSSGGTNNNSINTNNQSNALTCVSHPSLEALIGSIPTNPVERRAWAVRLVRHCYPVWQAWQPIVSSMTASLPPLETKEIEAVCEDTWEDLADKDSSARLPTLEAMAM